MECPLPHPGKCLKASCSDCIWELNLERGVGSEAESVGRKVTLNKVREVTARAVGRKPSHWSFLCSLQNLSFQCFETRCHVAQADPELAV